VASRRVGAAFVACGVVVCPLADGGDAFVRLAAELPALYCAAALVLSVGSLASKSPATISRRILSRRWNCSVHFAVADPALRRAAFLGVFTMAGG
jgi:hypothetical protein